jgi:ribose 5-phosphate isomerase B
MRNHSDADLKRIVEEVVSGLMREMPTQIQSIAKVESNAPADPVKSGAKSVAIGADHGGYAMKESLKSVLEEGGYQVIDCGTNSTDSVDYPDYARDVAQSVIRGKAWRGIMIDGAGIGSCMAANKVPGARAAMCYDHATASNAREHNNANILTLGAGMIGLNLAKQIVNTFLTTEFGGGRHARRVDKIMEIERK